MELAVIRPVRCGVREVYDRGWCNRIVKFNYVAALHLKRRFLQIASVFQAFDGLRDLLLMAAGCFCILLLIALPQDVFFQRLKFFSDR